MRRPATLLLLLTALCGLLAGCGNAASREAQNAEIAILRADLDAARADLDAVRAAVAGLEELQTTNAALRARTAELAERVAALDSQLEALRQPVEDATEAADVRRCKTHLRQLVMLFVTDQMERPGRPRYDGSALLLHYRQRGLIQAGDEDVLLCDLDPLALHPGGEVESDAWETADLAAPPRGLCSYAVRDFGNHPLGACEKLAVACCPHHPEGAVVAYEDGSVDLVPRADLDVPAGEAIEVGPGARSDLLRPLAYRVR